MPKCAHCGYKYPDKVVKIDGTHRLDAIWTALGFSGDFICCDCYSKRRIKRSNK